ncbi:hypothetical protein SAMN05192553_10568 [Cyclobacterium xiamenense]|uniref:Uncharacterized protein n=1 Tax=Cyclobacterium xiamenense TaxID=1297121 RepID=A0A1H6ZU49_9BACT|nr:hypothetical protein SAMN05192553_10568 [Cyclobacterium xiamenense]
MMTEVKENTIKEFMKKDDYSISPGPDPFR